VSICCLEGVGGDLLSGDESLLFESKGKCDINLCGSADKSNPVFGSRIRNRWGSGGGEDVGVGAGIAGRAGKNADLSVGEVDLDGWGRNRVSGYLGSRLPPLDNRGNWTGCRSEDGKLIFSLPD
jgi:hypothetical protein